MLHPLAALARVVAGAAAVRRTGAVVARWWTALVAGGVVGGLVGGVVGAVVGGEVGGVSGGVGEVGGVVGIAVGDAVATVGVCVGLPGALDPHPVRTTAATPATTAPAIRLRVMR